MSHIIEVPITTFEYVNLSALVSNGLIDLTEAVYTTIIGGQVNVNVVRYEGEDEMVEDPSQNTLLTLHKAAYAFNEHRGSTLHSVTLACGGKLYIMVD